MKIVAYRMRDDIDIEFLDDFHYVKKHNTYSNFKSGSVKNPYDRTLLGVGYLGDGEYMARKNQKLIDWCDKNKWNVYTFDKFTYMACGKGNSNAKEVFITNY